MMTMRMIWNLLVSSICFFIIAACSTDRRLESALAFAGSNRGELEKVLLHYEQEPEKQEAARFLIRNMPHWYAHQGWQLDSLQQELLSTQKPKETMNRWKNVSFYSLPKVYDAHVITADYLIENIDLSFQVWKTYPWNRTLSFDDFCELILPYRIADEPLSSWRKIYLEHYGALLDSVYSGSDILEACRTVCKELGKQGFYYLTDMQTPHLSGEVLFHRPVGYCRDACDFAIYAMRACGIPVSTDFFKYSPDYQHYHSWNVLRDTTGHFISFDFAELLPARSATHTDGRKKGKVYRYCFGAQDEEDSYVKDVTTQYFAANQVTVPLQVSDEYIYVGVFSPNGWVLIDKAKSRGDKVTFRNLEPNIIYQPLIFDGERQRPAGYPFIHRGDYAEILEPDKANPASAVLTRKMAIKPRISEWLYRAIVGARIEASNHPSFKQADLLYEFKDTLTTNYYEFDAQCAHKKFAYIRYVPPTNTRAELAELTLYKDSLCSVKIPLHIHTPIQPVDQIDNITDDNILTYFQAREMTQAITYKLDQPSVIHKIGFSPRNDDNYIWPGNRYELFYHNGSEGWVSLGIKTAAGRSLSYQVPRNALFWLRNRTKGREEQIFVYKNGKQCFTIDICPIL